MDELDFIVVLSFFGFLIAAYVLLAPVYFFLKREEQASRYWTEDELARRLRDAAGPAHADAHAEDTEQTEETERPAP